MYPFNQIFYYSRIIGIIIGVIYSILLPITAYAEYGKPRSMDELLEYTLSDFKARMKEAVESNNRTFSRNNALRHRMLSYRKQIRELENRKIRLLEEAIELSDIIKLEAKESLFMKRKLRDVKELTEQLKNEQGEIGKRIDAAPRYREKLNYTKEALLAELAGYRKDLSARNISKVKDEYSKEKHVYMQLLNESSRRLRDGQQEIVLFKRRMKGMLARQDKLISDQGIFKEEVNKIKQEIKAIDNEEKELTRNAGQMKLKKSKVKKDITDEIVQLEQYRDGLTSVLHDILDAEANVSSEFKIYQPDLMKKVRSLKKEKEYLISRQDGVSGLLELLREQKDRVEQENTISSSKATLNAHIKGLVDERDTIQAGISQAKVRQKEFDSTEKDLNKGINDFTKKVSSLKKQNQVKQEDVLDKEKHKYSKILRNSQRKLKNEEKGIAKLKKYIDVMLVKKDALLSEKGLLKESLLEVRKELQAIDNEEKGLKEKFRQIQSQNDMLIENEAMDFSQLEQYRDGLTQVINEFLDAQKHINSEFKNHQADLMEKRKFFARQKEYLIKQQFEVLSLVGLLKEKKSEIEQKGMLSSSKDTLQLEVVLLDSESDTMQDAILLAKAKQQELNSSKKILDRSINAFQMKLALLSDKSINAKKNIIKKEKQRLLGLLKESRVKTKMAQKEIDRIEISKERSSTGINRAARWKDAKDRELDNLKKDLLGLEAEESVLLYNKSKLQRRQKSREFEVREEIKTLRLRAEVLDSSLSVINSKYDAKDVVIKEFMGEERELKEYLDILKEESFGLKQKMTAVKDALNRLKEK